METLDNFCNKLKLYKTIAQKICETENLKEDKISVFSKEFTYSSILEKIDIIDNQLKTLKKDNVEKYLMLSLEFDTIYASKNNNIENIFLKQYNILSTNNIPLQKISVTPWEDLFTTNKSEYATLLKNDFPYNDIKNNTGIIYIKYLALLHICFWLEEKINIILNKDDKALNNISKLLLKNKEINKKLTNVDSSNLNEFLQFLKNQEQINETVKNINKIEKDSKTLIDELSLYKIENLTLQDSLKKTKEETEQLLKMNKELSAKLSSKALSGTFEKAAYSYNWSKRSKLFLIITLSIGLFYFAYDMLKNFDIQKMILMEKTPLVLLIYSTPRLFIFAISLWVLKFLISNYNNDSKVALDFKNRQAIADVTPHFKKELESNEKQEDLVIKAFDIFLSNPKTNINEKEKLLSLSDTKNKNSGHNSE